MDVDGLRVVAWALGSCFHQETVFSGKLKRHRHKLTHQWMDGTNVWNKTTALRYELSFGTAPDTQVNILCHQPCFTSINPHITILNNNAFVNVVDNLTCLPVGSLWCSFLCDLEICQVVLQQNLDLVQQVH